MALRKLDIFVFYSITYIVMTKCKQYFFTLPTVIFLYKNLFKKHLKFIAKAIIK